MPQCQYHKVKKEWEWRISRSDLTLSDELTQCQCVAGEGRCAERTLCVVLRKTSTVFKAGATKDGVVNLCSPRLIMWQPEGQLRGPEVPSSPKYGLTVKIRPFETCCQCVRGY